MATYTKVLTGVKRGSIGGMATTPSPSPPGSLEIRCYFAADYGLRPEILVTYAGGKNTVNDRMAMREKESRNDNRCEEKV